MLVQDPTEESQQESGEINKPLITAVKAPQIGTHATIAQLLLVAGLTEEKQKCMEMTKPLVEGMGPKVSKEPIIQVHLCLQCMRILGGRYHAIRFRMV